MITIWVWPSVILFFAIYAFGGWVLETGYASLRNKRFVNRGFLRGCFCPIYGCGVLIIMVAYEWIATQIHHPLVRGASFVCLSIVLITWVEYLTGWILEKAFKRKWWDYSGNKMNIGGHVCVKYSLLWGGIAYLIPLMLHPVAAKIVDGLPDAMTPVLAWTFLLYFALDIGLSISEAWKSRKSIAEPPVKGGAAHVSPAGCLRDAEYFSSIEDLIGHEQIQRMGSFIQHGDTSCLEHSLSVSYRSYLLCRKYRLDFRAAARGGLLHDLFLYDWHIPEPGRRRWHGFTHPRIALRNAEACFDLNEVEKDIIRKHMWPLTPAFPRFRESWVVSMVDKYITMQEFVGNRGDRHIFNSVNKRY